MSIEEKIDDLEDFLKSWKEEDVLYMDASKLDVFFQNKLNNYDLQQTLLTCIYGVKIIDKYSFEDFKDSFSKYEKDDIWDYLKSLELTNGESLWDLFEYFTNSNISEGGSLALEIFSRSGEVGEIIDFLLSYKNPHRERLKKEIPVLSLKLIKELEIDWIDDRFKFYQFLKFKNVECSIYESFFKRNYENLNTEVIKELKDIEDNFVLKTDYSYISNLLKQDYELIINKFMYHETEKEFEYSLMLKKILDNRDKGYHQRFFFNKLLKHTQQNEPESEYEVLLGSLKTFKDASKRGHNVDEQISSFLQNINFKVIEKSLINIVENKNLNGDYTAEIIIDKKAWGVLFLLKNFEKNAIIPERFNDYFDKLFNAENYGFWSFNIEDSLSLVLNRINLNQKMYKNEKSSDSFEKIELNNEKHLIAVKLGLKEEFNYCLPVIKEMLLEALLNLTKIDQKIASAFNQMRKNDLNNYFKDYIYDLVDNEIMKLDLRLETDNQFFKENKGKRKILKF